MVDPELIDLVVVHGTRSPVDQKSLPGLLAYLEGFLPDARERRSRLKAAGSCLPI